MPAEPKALPPAKIRMNTTAAGPGYVYQMGQVYVVSGDIAKTFIDLRAAEPYVEPKKPAKEKDEEDK